MSNWRNRFRQKLFGLRKTCPSQEQINIAVESAFESILDRMNEEDAQITYCIGIYLSNDELGVEAVDFFNWYGPAIQKALKEMGISSNLEWVTDDNKSNLIVYYKDLIAAFPDIERLETFS